MGQLLRRGRLLFLLVLCWGLAACESMPEVLITTGTGGIRLQAERLVAQVYGLSSEPLPFNGPNIVNSLESMKARWPSLKPLLEGGLIGFTEDGDVAIRYFGGRDKAGVKELRRLVRAENADRQVLYRAVTDAGGFSGDVAGRMLGFTEDAFAEQWVTQAPAGWWIQDRRGEWFRKQ